MNAPEDILVLLILIAMLIVLGSLFARYKTQKLRHEERLKALEKGVEVPRAEPQAPWNPRIYLLRGMTWLFTGIGLMVFLFFAIVTSPPQRPDDLASRLLKVQTLRERGLPEDQLKELLAEKPRAPQGPPIGFAFVGLIPIGVGLAYLLFYRSEQRHLAAPSGDPDNRLPAPHAL